MKMVFTSGRKYTKLHSGGIEVCCFQKNREPRDWTKGSHSKLGFKIGVCVFC